MRKFLLLFFTLASVMCYAQNIATTDAGVVINGVRWATRNVAAPGTFAANPESAGMLFQWNRRQGWDAIGSASSWNANPAAGTSWTSDNDPCPQGWRVPTEAELHSLNNAPSTWTQQAGVNGSLFGSAPDQIFLPAAGIRGTHSSLNTAGLIGYYWSSSPSTATGAAMSLRFQQDHSSVVRAPRTGGFSVRCVAE